MFFGNKDEGDPGTGINSKVYPLKYGDGNVILPLVDDPEEEDDDEIGTFASSSKGFGGSEVSSSLLLF